LAALFFVARTLAKMEIFVCKNFEILNSKMAVLVQMFYSVTFD